MNNKKVIIGILPTSNYMLTDDTFKDTYRYGNNYIKKIYDNGAIPYLIPLNDEQIIKESLNFCDGLLLPGGDRVRPYSFKIIDYFVKNKKPVLGICLGMQTLAMYSVNIENKKEKRILKRIENNTHWPFNLLRDNNEDIAHNVIISKESKLHKIFGKDKMMVNSVHKSTITEVGSMFKVTIKSEDGLIEGIENTNDDNFIIGVQFHPEILPELNNLFVEFINSCQKNKF